MRPTSGVIVVALLLAACGAAPVGTNTTGTEPTTVATTGLSDGSTVGTTWVTPPIASNDDGVAVLVTATPVLQEDGSIELCPPGYAGPCPGIALEGDAGGVIATEDGPVVVQVIGWYDGSRLLAAAEPAVADFPPLEEVTFDSLCPGLEGSRTVEPHDGLIERVNNYATLQPEYAALWWDEASAIITVWFSGDATTHEEAIAAIAGAEPVCVVGGAQFSEAELMEAAELLDGFVDSRGEPLTIRGGYSVGGMQNRIDLPVEGVDAATRESLAELVGDRVTLYPFLEALDVPLSDLPAYVPAVAGDVDIVTDPARPWGGMDALGTFSLRYDADLNCVYFDGDEDGSGGRTVPIWPFSYSATQSPMTVYDFDGVPVANEGDTLELGGGFVDAQIVEGNRCGAESAWIINWTPGR